MTLAKRRVLILRSPAMSLARLQPVWESASFDVCESSSWAEAREVVSAKGSLDLVLVDAALLGGGGELRDLVDDLQKSSMASMVVVLRPDAVQDLGTMLRALGGRPDPAAASTGPTPVFVEESPGFRQVLALADRYADSDLTVLITGETGVGKEVFARYVHDGSRRKEGPFIACNLTAIPETLLESELFGYVRGAFTGADRNKRGLIEAAEGGTLFLDEIGDLAPGIQLKLLRFLESREFYRVGESTPRHADVRIVAATNADLEDDEQVGFRRDLYYRLNTARIIVPPLRERREDVLPLARELIAQTAGRLGRPAKRLSHSVESLFFEYDWPGNVRELRNVIDSALVVAADDVIGVRDLPMHLQQFGTTKRERIDEPSIRRIDEAEREVIAEALRSNGGERAAAARHLGISVRTLYRKIEKFPELAEKGREPILRRVS